MSKKKKPKYKEGDQVLFLNSYGSVKAGYIIGLEKSGFLCYIISVYGCDVDDDVILEMNILLKFGKTNG